jgi:hypothetical protein
MVKTARVLVYSVCLLLLFHSVLLHADVIPGRWEKVEVQKQGTELALILQSGEPVYGLLKEVTHDTVIVIEEDGGQRSVTKSSIHLVETTRIDSTRSGTLIGLAIGGALGSISGAVFAAGFSDSPKASDTLGAALILGAIGAGMGAAFGYTVEKWVDHKRPEVLYVAN